MTLGMGFSPVVFAKMKWIEITDYAVACPDVCQQTKNFHPEHSEFNVPFAVPAGIHKPTKKRFMFVPSIMRVPDGEWVIT
jgi:hypothetical protein